MPVVHVLRERRGDPADRRDARSSATSTRQTFGRHAGDGPRGADAAHQGRHRRPPVRQRRARRARSRRSGVPVVEDAAQAAGSIGPGRAARRARAPSRRSPSTRRRTSARSATAARSRRATTTLADRVRTLRFHGSRDKVTYEAGRLQLAPRRAAGRGPARACCPSSTHWAAHRRAVGRLVRGGGPRRARRAAGADARRARRRGTSTCRASSARRRAAGGPAGAPASSARAVLPHAGPPPAGDGAYVRDAEPACRGPTRPRARTSRCRSAPRSRASRSTRSSCRALRPMRVWVDLTNSPHVLVLRAGRSSGCARGAPRSRSRRATSRRPSSWPSATGSSATVIGRHRGGRLARQGGSGCSSTARPRSLRWARGRRFDLALGHGSNDVTVAARLLRIPSSTMFDYEWATVQHTINCRLAQAVVVPDAIPPERLARYGARRQAPALPGPEGGVLPRRPRARPGRARRARPRPRGAARRRAHPAGGVALPPLREPTLRAGPRPAARPGPGRRAAAHAGAARRAAARRAASSSPSTRSTGRRSSAYADLVVSAGRHDEPRGGGARHARSGRRSRAASAPSTSG